MLRALALLLVLANAAFFAWSQGWLDGVAGLNASPEREPQRMEHQSNAGAVRLLPSQAASAALAAAARPRPTSCLEAGPFDDAAVAAAELALAGLPPGSWTRASTVRPAVWSVYMGRFAEREARQKKEDELRRLRLAWEEISAPPELAPGLSLGRYASREEADAALQGFAQRNVRTARVVQLQAPLAQHLLRIERADSALAAQAGQLNAAALNGAFRPCGS